MVMPIRRQEVNGFGGGVGIKAHESWESRAVIGSESYSATCQFKMKGFLEQFGYRPHQGLNRVVQRWHNCGEKNFEDVFVAGVFTALASIAGQFVSLAI